jgi:hypothetical protein
MLFMGFLSSVGLAGLNAMAASGSSADADCGDCTACLECTDKFSLYFDTGTAFTRHDGYVQATSVESALTGSQSVAITTNNADNCCYVLQATDVDGNPVGGLNAYVPCGSAIPSYGAAFGHSGINCTILVNTVLYYSNNHDVFTIRIYLSDSPCE